MFEDLLATLPSSPPRQPALLPGLRLSEAAPRALLLLPLVFIVLFSALPLVVLSLDPMARLELGPSPVAHARVLSTTDASSCRNSRSRRVGYTFASPCGDYRGSATLCAESPYFSIETGEDIPVKYLRSKPQINSVAQPNANDPPPAIFFMFFPFMALLVFLPMFMPRMREILRARATFKTGRLTSGQVVFVKRRMNAGMPGWPSSPAADVYVKYQTLAGQPQEGKAWFANEWLMQQLTPGATVHIAYTDKNPERLVLLDAFVR